MHKSSRFPFPRGSTLHRQQGLTLVEWMVSITIGMFLVIGLAALVGQQSGTRRSIDNTGRLIENGRFATQILAKDIQLAGYLGELTVIPNPPGAIPNPCSLVVADIDAALPLHIQGYNAPSGVGIPGCVSNLKAGTDIIVVRRADVVPLAVGTAAPGQLYLQTGLTPAGTVFQRVVDVAPAANPEAVFDLETKEGDPAPLRRYLTHIYYVSACNVCAPNDGIPTLKRVELALSGVAMTTTTVALVEGIDNLQIDFGLDYIAPTAATAADGSADTYTAGTFSDGVATAMTATDWSNVVSVRLHVVSRSVEIEAGYQDTKTYNLGLSGTTVAANDAYKRHVFTQLVRVVNPSGRRGL